MITGDLSTMSLPDLLQWMDATRAEGWLTVSWDEGETWLRIADRAIVEVSPPTEGAATLRHLRPREADVPWLRLPPDVEATERTLDLFLFAHARPGGRFHLCADTPAGEAGVAVSLPIAQAVYEGMRHLDELPALEATWPDDGVVVSATGAQPTGRLSPLGRVLLRCAARDLTLGAIRVTLGLSRLAILRGVHDLVERKLATAGGAPEGAGAFEEPVSRTLAMARQLLDAEQFDEVAHVLDAILEADPGEQRARELRAETVRRQRDALYDALGAETVPVILEPDLRGSPRITGADLEVVEGIDGTRTVTALVERSALREVEALKILQKLFRLGLLGRREDVPA